MQNSMKKAAAVATAAVTSLGMFAFATPAFASVNSTHITITTTNRGSIENVTTARSSTGGNSALGSQGGAGGSAGDITNGAGGSENNGGAVSGNGGNGGNGGAGGLVTTGNASADAGTSNDLNNTNVDLGVGTDCGCDVNGLTLDLTTDNSRTDPTQNVIGNLTTARARTGGNSALGSVGGDAGTGGVVDGGTGSENNGGATSGSGGAGGAGGLGGTIATGNASTTSGTINMLNTALIRVRI